MTGLSAITRLDQGAALLRSRLETLSRQVSDGRRGTNLGDIAPEARRAIDLRAEVGRREAYTRGIEQTLGQNAVAQTTLGTLSEIAERAYVLAQRIGSGNRAGIAAAAQEARGALVQVAQLLNEQYAGQYIFGGKDTDNPPVPSPETIASSGMVTQITTAVQGLVPGGANAVRTATLAAASSDAAGVTPFSAYLSDPARGLTETRRAVPGRDGQLVPYGLFANRNAAGASVGDTTGSWARDLLRGLASLGAVQPGQAALGGDFDALMTNLRQGFQDTISGLSQEQGALGVTEARLESLKRDHAAVTVTLTSQIADIEEVDLAEVISRMQATQTQLEASYRAIALASELTLTRFL